MRRTPATAGDLTQGGLLALGDIGQPFRLVDCLWFSSQGVALGCYLLALSGRIVPVQPHLVHCRRNCRCPLGRLLAYSFVALS